MSQKERYTQDLHHITMGLNQQPPRFIESKYPSQYQNVNVPTDQYQ